VLSREPGVISYELDTMSDVTTIDYDPAKTTVKKIVADLAVTGHKPSEVVER
jgi:hypothetical protein